uniref:MTA3p n=1 Tax=Tetrahymena thermophila TaxID=5911 RepID=M1KJB1_TETTH|nr:MTA3p [Tetrahymena thermophila]
MMILIILICSLFGALRSAKSLDQGIIIEVKHGDYKFIKIVTNDESSIKNFNGKLDQLNSKIFTINQIVFQQPKEDYCFLPSPQNTFGRIISQEFYDENMNLINSAISNIHGQVLIKNTTQKLIDAGNGQKWLSVILNAYQQFQIISNQINSIFQIYTTIPNLTTNQSAQSIFSLLIDGKKMNCFFNQTNTGIKNGTLFTQNFYLSDFPTQFQDLEIQFFNPFFPTFSLSISSGADFLQFQISNQLYSSYLLYNSNPSAMIIPQSDNLIANQLVFILQSDIFSQCYVQQLDLPSNMNTQFSFSQPVLNVQNPQNRSQSSIIDSNFYNGTISFVRNQNLRVLPSQVSYSDTLVAISSFLDVIGFDNNLTMTFVCSQNLIQKKSIRIIKNEYLNANQTQVSIQVNNLVGTKNISIQISIPSVTIQNTSLIMQLPQSILFQDNTQQSLDVQGFVYSNFVWQQNNLAFFGANFSSTILRLSFTNIDVKNQTSNVDILNSTFIIAKCIFNQTFVFYVDSNTNQTVKIIQPTPLPRSQITLSSFNQTKVNSLDVPESRTSVQSQIAFSFSVLNFLDTCSWLIVQIPFEFTIGFIQMSQFTLQDCFGNIYSYLQGSSILPQSMISYTDNNNCMYISCSSLRLNSQMNSSSQCMNNTVIIQSIKSPDQAVQTSSLNIYIANQNSSAPSNIGPPTFFTQNLNLKNNSLPYFFIPTEVYSHVGINITEADFSDLNFNISSNYYGDVFNLTTTISYPFYLYQQHQISIQIPVRILANQSVVCYPESFLSCSIKIPINLNFTTILIQILQQVSPNTKIAFQLNQVVASQSLLQGKQAFALIQVSSTSKIINTKNKTIDVLNNLKLQSWINIDAIQPLQISNTLLGQEGVNYTFAILSLQIPSNQLDNYYLSLKIDQSLSYNSSNSNCYSLTQVTGDNSQREEKVNCINFSSNTFLIPISKNQISQPFQLRITGLRNPSGIVEQNVAQTYNFQLIWSTQQGNSFKNVWVIQSVSLPITSKYTCSPNCQACASNYAACTACAPGYLKSQYNHHAVLACLPTCSPQYVAYNGTCLACQLKDPQCLSCSPSNLTQCSSCNQGYTLVPEFNGCVDSHLLQTARSRLLDYSLSTNLADNIDTTHPDDAQKSDKAQSLTRMTEESSSAKADQREGGESSSNTGSKVMGQLQDTVGALKGGGAIFIWIVLAALAVSVSQSVLRYTYNKLKGKSHSNGSSSGMRRSSSGSRSSSSGSSSAGRNASGKEHKGVREREKELRGQRIDCLMLFLLSVAEAIQMPYTLLWGFSVSGGDFESPVLQTLLGACALSTLLWIFDAYLLGSILANSENTPKTSCLLNPLPSSKREGCLSFLIVPARLAFCLIPKSVSLTLTNIFSVEGWFRYPYGEDVERATIVLTNFRKVLSSQIKSNVSGLCSLVSFLILQYPEVLSSYVQIYDLIIFDIVMTILCLTNIRNVDKLISTLNQIQESEGEL